VVVFGGFGRAHSHGNLKSSGLSHVKSRDQLPGHCGGNRAINIYALLPYDSISDIT
jgi:hypothetical protein